MTFAATPRDSSNLPLSCVYIPGVGIIALQGTTAAAADGSGNISTSALITLTGPQATDAFQSTVFAAGELRVQEEPTSLFLDDFGTGLDTTNRWKSPSSGGGGVAATNTVGSTALGTGTTANGYSYLESVTTFLPRNPGWNQWQASINMTFPYVANTYHFWGFGTSPATPTAAAPLTDAAGFEIAVGGKMYAVCYASGTRNVIQDLSAATGNSKQPTDANVHIYTVFFRGDRAYWCIDGLDAVVATMLTGASGPNVNTLPAKFTSIAGTSAPGSSSTITVNQIFVSDTTRQNIQISDGTFPWRKVTVDSSGNLHVAISGALAAGTNVIGSTTIQATSGTALVADQGNTELRVSNYGKNATAGDTASLVDSTGRVLIGRSTTAAYTLASTATSGSTQNSSDLAVGSYTEISIDINTTAQSGTNPTIQYFYERKGADGIYYPLWQSAVLTSATNTLSTSIGTGMAYNQSLGITGRLRWVIGGSATPTYTHTLNIYAK